MGGRIFLAALAVSKGISISSVTSLLDWKEFEHFTASAFEAMGFQTVSDVRFKLEKVRGQIDVVALKNCRILTIDCKKWKRLSAIKNAARHHVKRSKMAREKLYGLAGCECEKIKVFPIIVCISSEKKMTEGCYLVEITKLRSFIELLESGFFDNKGSLLF